MTSRSSAAQRWGATRLRSGCCRAGIALAALLAGALPASAQGLAEAFERAWANHPQAGTWDDRAAEAQARAEIATGITPGPPAVSMSTMDDRLGSDRGRRELEVELAVPLWLPGQKSAQGEHARAAIEEVSARRNALRWQLAGELRQAWWAVAAARNALALAGRRAASARLLESDVVRRFETGDLSRIDANLARDERIAAEADQFEAAAGVARAEIAYRVLTGSEAPAALSEEDAAADSAQAHGVHPRVESLEAIARVARARLTVMEASGRAAPELAVRVARERGDFAEPFGNAVGVKLTIPFAAGPRTRQLGAAGRAEAVQAEAELARARVQARLDEQRARSDLDAAERQLGMASQRRAITADNLRLAERSFALGESALFTLLRARAQAFEAEAFLDRQRIARAAARSRLNQALGVMP